jgi:hypothetical protein
MPDGEQIVAPANTLYGDTHSLCSGCLVLAHEKAIYQRNRDGDERQNMNRAGGVEYKEPEDVEEQQNYKNYPGHYLSGSD